MKQITQPTTLPEWFMQANSKAQFSAKEIATLFNCYFASITRLLNNKESFENGGIANPNAARPRKFYSKQTILNFIQTLPTTTTGEHS